MHCSLPLCFPWYRVVCKLMLIKDKTWGHISFQLLTEDYNAYKKYSLPLERFTFSLFIYFTILNHGWKFWLFDNNKKKLLQRSHRWLGVLPHQSPFAWSLSFWGHSAVGRFTRAKLLPFFNDGFNCTPRDIHWVGNFVVSVH